MRTQSLIILSFWIKPISRMKAQNLRFYQNEIPKGQNWNSIQRLLSQSQSLTTLYEFFQRFYWSICTLNIGKYLLWIQLNRLVRTMCLKFSKSKNFKIFWETRRFELKCQTGWHWDNSFLWLNRQSLIPIPMIRDQKSGCGERQS